MKKNSYVLAMSFAMALMMKGYALPIMAETINVDNPTMETENDINTEEIEKEDDENDENQSDNEENSNDDDLDDDYDDENPEHYVIDNKSSESSSDISVTDSLDSNTYVLHKNDGSDKTVVISEERIKKEYAEWMRNNYLYDDYEDGCDSSEFEHWFIQTYFNHKDNNDKTMYSFKEFNSKPDGTGQVVPVVFKDFYGIGNGAILFNDVANNDISISSVELDSGILKDLVHEAYAIYRKVNYNTETVDELDFYYSTEPFKDVTVHANNGTNETIVISANTLENKYKEQIQGYGVIPYDDEGFWDTHFREKITGSYYKYIYNSQDLKKYIA